MEIEIRKRNYPLKMFSTKLINLFSRASSLVSLKSKNAILKQKKRGFFSDSVLLGQVPEFRKVPNGLEFQNLFVDDLWLRINCRCEQCYHAKSHQRELSFVNVDSNVTCDVLDVSTCGQLRVTWSDKHESVYDAKWVVRNAAGGPSKPEVTLWSGDHWTSNAIPNVEYEEQVPNKVLVRQVLKNILVYGFCSVSKVEPKFEEVERLIRKIVPIQKNFWGEMWNVRAEESKSDYDTAYSSRPLPPHTDNTYLAYPPGLQVFSCLEPAAVGGETLLVDGFRCARALSREEPEAYERLTSTPVQSLYEDDHGNRFTHCDQVLKIGHRTGQLQQIRFNPLDVGTLSNLRGEELRAFYSAYQSLAEEVVRASSRLTIKWTPGTVVFVDNWRVLHGREAFSGARHLCGCYVSRDDYVQLLHTFYLQ